MAAASGCNFWPKPEGDFETIDGGFSFDSQGVMGAVHIPRIDFQLKCQLEPPPAGAPDFPYELTQRSYDHLRSTNRSLPIILIVVCVPRDPGQWVGHQPHQRMDLSHAAYWMSLHGLPGVRTATKTVRIPTAQEFTIASLHQMMQEVGEGADHL